MVRIDYILNSYFHINGPSKRIWKNNNVIKKLHFSRILALILKFLGLKKPITFNFNMVINLYPILTQYDRRIDRQARLIQGVATLL